MSTLRNLTKVIEAAKIQAANTKAGEPRLTEVIGDGESALYGGDNLKVMKHLLDQGYGGKLKLIYIDPPFFTKASYDAVLKVGGENIKHPAYDDKWQRGLYWYLRELTARLIIMKELLADDGLIWLHLDWHAVHYAKIIMDEIFGESRFVNEIIWTYKSGGSSKKRFARKHDNILVYSKTGTYDFQPLEEKSYNRQFKPYRFKGVKEYKDDVGWYTMVNMKDVWTIDMVGRTSAERTGYATQKPELLIERIVDCCTSEGDICADFFCGSGTLPAVAARRGRRFIGCDVGSLAVESTVARLSNQKSGFRVFGTQAGHEAGVSASLEAEFKIDYDDILSSDKRFLKIELLSAREKRLSSAIDEKSKDTIRKSAKADPLAVVEAWSVDYDYDGQVHRPTAVFLRNRGRIESACEKIVDGRDRVVHIKVVDIMGNVTYYEGGKQNG